MLLSVLLQTVLCAVNFQPAQLPKDKPAAENANLDYVKLTAEIRGTLQVEKSRIVVIVNQGGGSLFVYDDVWILEFGKDEALKASAAKLDGKAVVLTGEPDRPIALPHKTGAGAKSGKPPRLVVHVTKITAAPAK